VDAVVIDHVLALVLGVTSSLLLADGNTTHRNIDTVRVDNFGHSGIDLIAFASRVERRQLLLDLLDL
jgi:hypothetical protein